MSYPKPFTPTIYLELEKDPALWHKVVNSRKALTHFLEYAKKNTGATIDKISQEFSAWFKNGGTYGNR